MVATTICEAPLPESYKTREEHESQTPESFYLGKPVLYSRVTDATVVMTAHHFPAPDIFHLPCAASPEDRTRIKEKVDIMVTSEYVFLLMYQWNTNRFIETTSCSITGLEKAYKSPTQICLLLQPQS